MYHNKINYSILQDCDALNKKFALVVYSDVYFLIAIPTGNSNIILKKKIKKVWYVLYSFAAYKMAFSVRGFIGLDNLNSLIA